MRDWKHGRASVGGRHDDGARNQVGKRTLTEQIGEASGEQTMASKPLAAAPMRGGAAGSDSGRSPGLALFGGQHAPLAAGNASAPGGDAAAAANGGAAGGGAAGGGATSAAPPTLTWTTGPAPSGGNKRFTVGPGEQVTFTGSRAGTWSASGGQPTSGEGETFAWKASDKPGIYTIKLKADDKEATQGISVLVPTQVHFKKVAQQNAGPGEAGVGMTLDMDLGPKNVSFDEIQIQEQPGGAAVATGPFAKMPNAHEPKSGWTDINFDNTAASQDDAWAGPFDLPVEMGTLVWDIPYLWKPVDGGASTPFAIVKQTASVVDSKGTMTITKGSASATWRPVGPPKPGKKLAPDRGGGHEGATGGRFGSPGRAGRLERLGGSWVEVVPKLQSKNHDNKAKPNPRDQGIATVDNTPGEAPTVSYNPNTSEKVGGEPDDALVEAEVQAVIAARHAIPARDVTRDPLNQKKGNYYNPNKDQSGAAADYQAWRNTRLPSVQFDANDAKDKRKWEIFTRIWRHEGDPGIVTTFDKTLTIGAGFSSAGTQAERVLGYALDRLPDAKAAAFGAGLVVNGNSMTAVDTEKKVIVSGAAAAAYVQTVPELISFISNLIIGAQTDADGNAPDADGAQKQRQTMLDAQWVAFLGASINGIPDAMLLSWDEASLTVAVHARHAIPATFPWSVFAGSAPGPENVVRTIYKTLKAHNMAKAWFHPIVNGEYDAMGKKVLAEDNKATEKRMLETEQSGAYGDDAAQCSPNSASAVCDGTSHE